MVSPTPGDLLLCSLVRQRQLLTDEQLEAAICQWLAESQRPLLDVIALHAKLPPVEFRLLAETLEKHATETCADPVSLRLRALPTSIRRLLAPHVSDVTLASESGFDTMVEE